VTTDRSRPSHDATSVQPPAATVPRSTPSRWLWVNPRTHAVGPATRQPEPTSPEVHAHEAAGDVLIRDIGNAMEVHPHDPRRWRSVHSDLAKHVRAWAATAHGTDPTTVAAGSAVCPADPCLRTPGGTCFVPRRRGQTLPPGTTGTYTVRAGGLILLDATGEPFACLVANRHHERFFVSCARHAAGIWYSYGLNDDDAGRIGIRDLGYGDRQHLATAWWTQAQAARCT
jgi:hypothetical protein